ncbi:MAG: hypothetical protein ACLT76_04915 [Clostridium fessum]
MQYAIAHLDPNEDNPSMEENPCINVDFENEEESCLEAATMMMDEGYKMVTPFSLRTAAKQAHTPGSMSMPIWLSVPNNVSRCCLKLYCFKVCET